MKLSRIIRFLYVVPIIAIILYILVSAILGILLYSPTFWDEIVLSPEYRIKFYLAGGMGYPDLYYKVYYRQRKIFTSEIFPVACLPDMDGCEKFGAYQVGGAYFAIYNTREPDKILIMLDIQQSIYGKKTRSCGVNVEYHEQFNAQMVELLKKFRHHLHNDHLYLDSSHYNCTEESHFFRSSREKS